MKYIKKLKVLLILLVIFSNFASAEVFKLNNIHVQGLQKFDDGIVLSSFPVEIGENFDTNNTSQYIKAIYKTGYFKSITINRNNNNIIIYVKEKPSVSKIKIIGNDSFETEALNKALDAIGITEGGTFDEFTLSRLKQELEQQYLSQGKYSVKINTDVTALERNRVKLTINISEGRAAKIKEIRIIGNNTFSKDELLEGFKLTEGGLLSWITFSDRYSKQKLTGDLERLKSFYLDRGYLNFTITDAQISITPDKKDVYIVIQVIEGSIYKIGNVNVGGRTDAMSSKINALVNVQKGDTYSSANLSNIESSMLAELGRNGYLFAKVDTTKNIDEKKKLVNVTFFAKPGKRVYVRRITFVGNLKTQDEVLRREILQMEGGYVSREKIELSKTRMAQLGYIKDINVETIPVSGSNDQVDLKYTLGESNTGHFNGGVGYMEKEGFMFNLGLSQDNFFGSGKSVSTTFNKSKASTSSNLSFFDPYFTIDGIGLGYNVFYNKTKLDELDISSYKLDIYGADINLRVPLSLYDLLSANFGAQNKKIRSSKNSSAQIKKLVNRHGDSYDLYSTGLSWQHSELNRALFPTRGWSNQLNGHIMIPGSDLNYFMIYNSTKIYVPIYDEFILYLKGNVAHGSGYNSDSSLPFFENYFAGGVGTVRGFAQNSLGPKDSLGDNIGGNSLLAGTVELYLPKLFASNVAWRPSVFIDAGNVYDGHLNLNKIRAAGGFGVQWLSPMGPLSISYATPIQKFTGDELKGFNFNVGSIF